MLRAFGDMFTKIGGGVFGGSVVAFYFNFILKNTPYTFENLNIYFCLLGFGLLSFAVGYFIIWTAKKSDMPL